MNASPFRMPLFRFHLNIQVLLTGLLMILVALVEVATVLKAESIMGVPHYRILVNYNYDQRLLEGKMQVRFRPEVYPSGELLFALPMNRFRMQDERGARKHRLTPIFSLKRYQNILEDPCFPMGFSMGGINILSVRDNHGRKIDYRLESNPKLETGYSTEHGLLRVMIPEDLEYPELNIVFKTFLPQHTREGGINDNMITSQWHPQLLEWDQQRWYHDGNTPSPGIFEVSWSATQSGTLITSVSAHTDVPANQLVSLPNSNIPLKTFPLIFSTSYVHYQPDSELAQEQKGTGTHPLPAKRLESFYFEEFEEKAELIHLWVQKFLGFAELQYGLEAPWENIRIVAVEAEYEQITIINNLVLVPLPNYKRSRFLNRRVQGLVSLGLGQLWFGEKVWNHQDTGLWLSKGVPAFLGFRFFENQYGPNAGIFNFIDWMNPRFRDHFFEDMALGVTEGYRTRILSSFQDSGDPHSHLKIVTYKTAMVLSMLEHLVGSETFRIGLRNFFDQNLHRVADFEKFQQVFNVASKDSARVIPIQRKLHPKKNLNWFFNQWFRDIVSLDYALGESQSEQLPNGNYRISVEVMKLEQGQMPVEIMLQLEDGNRILLYVEGRESREKVVFETTSPPEKVMLDPEEKLLEAKRINNHSFSFHRVRFAHDWKKRREHLWILVPGVASNAIDGNSYGIGIRHHFDDYRIYAIPGYGTNNERFLYLFELDRENLGVRGMTVGFNVKEQAGIHSEGVRLNFSTPSNQRELSYGIGVNFSRERLFVARKDAVEGEFRETGNSNVFFIQHHAWLPLTERLILNWTLSNEQPSQELETDFAYSKSISKFGQTWHVGHRKWFELALLYGSISGTPPLQKKFQLGSPGTLRGYPQTIDLMDDHLMVSSFDFKFPLLHAPLWGDVSALNIQGTVFHDQGKSWTSPKTGKQASLRKNVGWGIEWVIDTMSLIQVPLKFEVAYPLDDPEYHKPQFILLGTLTWD